MPLPAIDATQVAAPRTPDAKAQRDNAALNKVSKQFESLLMSQLLEVMWKSSSALGGNEGQSDLYRQMFQGPLAEHLVDGGGIGLSRMIARGLGASDEHAHAPLTLPMPLSLASQLPPVAAAGSGIHTLTLDPARAAEPATGALRDLQLVAAGMLANGGSDRWARDGALTPQDLGSDLTTPAAAGGEARFSVRDANGYQGYYKCNLFAFEMARRAGLQVPVVAREAGWGFPSSNRVTQDASDGSLDAGWAKVATGTSPAAMQDALRAGEAAFMLVGSGAGERHGHMAVVERPRSIEYDSQGQVQRVVFDGWEAQPSGARHLTERAWNRAGHPGQAGDRNGLTRIEIIQLSRPGATQRPERTLSDTAKSSQLDSVSSNEPRRTTQGGKEHS